MGRPEANGCGSEGFPSHSSLPIEVYPRDIHRSTWKVHGKGNALNCLSVDESFAYR